MEYKLTKLFKEFYEVNQKINVNLLNQQFIVESSGQLYFSELGKTDKVIPGRDNKLHPKKYSSPKNQTNKPNFLLRKNF